MFLGAEEVTGALLSAGEDEAVTGLLTGTLLSVSAEVGFLEEAEGGRVDRNTADGIINRVGIRFAGTNGQL